MLLWPPRCSRAIGRFLGRWCVCRSRRRKPEDEVVDPQSKAWITLVLQLVYLLFLCGSVPYAFVTSPSSSPWFPIGIFLAVTGGCSIAMCVLYCAIRSIRLMYLSLVVYASIFPYVCWYCGRGYMATSAACWHWLTLSMVIMSLLSSWRQALLPLLLQTLTPIAGGLADAYGGHDLNLHALILRALSLVLPDITIFALLCFFCQVLKHSRNQALLRQELGEAILRNILPMPVAEQLMQELAYGSHCHIAHDYPVATVAFCDIVGFTQLCLSVTSTALVEMLNDIFTCFDRLCLIHGVEKIKTIGDAYMFAGFPTADEDPKEAAVAVVFVAVRMVRHVMMGEVKGHRLQIRSGVHSGPVVAGVIGCTKFAYDIWGPTVNLASRLESTGMPDEVQLSTATKELVAERVPCRFRGNIPLKGAGNHDVHLVDLTAMLPVQPEDPEVLRGMGLNDMAFLVQEINRRQVFAPGGAVAPIGAPLSPANLGLNRLGPITPRPPRGLSIVPGSGEYDEPEMSRAGRIMRLFENVEASAAMSPSDALIAFASIHNLRQVPGSNLVTGQLEQVLSSPNLLVADTAADSPRARSQDGSPGRTRPIDINLEIPFLPTFQNIIPNAKPFANPGEANSDRDRVSDRSRQSEASRQSSRQSESAAPAPTALTPPAHARQLPCLLLPVPEIDIGERIESPRSSNGNNDQDLAALEAMALTDLCTEANSGLNNPLGRNYRGPRHAGDGARRQSVSSISSTGSPPRMTRRHSLSPQAPLMRRQSLCYGSPNRNMRRASVMNLTASRARRLSNSSMCSQENDGDGGGGGGGGFLGDPSTSMHGSPPRMQSPSRPQSPLQVMTPKSPARKGSQDSQPSQASNQSGQSYSSAPILQYVFGRDPLTDRGALTAPLSPHHGPLPLSSPLYSLDQPYLSSSFAPSRCPNGHPTPPSAPRPFSAIPRFSINPPGGSGGASPMTQQRHLLMPIPPERPVSPLRHWRERWGQDATANGPPTEDWRERLLPPFMRSSNSPSRSPMET